MLCYWFKDIQKINVQLWQDFVTWVYPARQVLPIHLGAQKKKNVNFAATHNEICSQPNDKGGPSLPKNSNQFCFVFPSDQKKNRQVQGYCQLQMLKCCIWLEVFCASLKIYIYVYVYVYVYVHVYVYVYAFRSLLSCIWSLSTATLRKHSVHHAEPSKASCAPIPQGATSLWLQLHDLNWPKSKAFSEGFLQAGHGKCLHDSLCRLCLYHNFLAKHDPFSCFLCWLILGLDHA